MTAGSETGHPAWCPVDHSRYLGKGLIEGVLCILDETAGINGESVVDLVFREVHDDLAVPLEHVYLASGDADGMAVGFYGLHSSDVARNLSLLHQAVGRMIDFEANGMAADWYGEETARISDALTTINPSGTRPAEAPRTLLQLSDDPGWCEADHDDAADDWHRRRLAHVTLPGDREAGVWLIADDYGAHPPYCQLTQAGPAGTQTVLAFQVSDALALASLFASAVQALCGLGMPAASQD
jgi:hypothetical protein